MIVVAGIVEDDHGRILLALRPEGKHLAGYWEFPGGKVEGSEQPDQALIRELNEELSLQIEIQRLLGTYEFSYDWGPLTMHVFIVRAKTQPQVSEDVPDFKFVEPKEVGSFRLAPADVKPYEDYCALQT